MHLFSNLKHEVLQYLSDREIFRKKGVEKRKTLFMLIKFVHNFFFIFETLNRNCYAVHIFLNL
jgi:hypothetical protein